MKIAWNALKNERLKKIRGMSFDEILRARLVALRRHPARELQELMLFEYRNYIWAVPFVRTREEIFLKTLYPSRYWTKRYRRGEL